VGPGRGHTGDNRRRLGPLSTCNVRPLDRLEDYSRKLEDHDFSIDVDLGERSELNVINVALNKMVESMRRLGQRRCTRSATRFAGSSNLMASVAKETSDAVQGTAATVSGLARGAEDQVNSMMVASTTINENGGPR